MNRFTGAVLLALVAGLTWAALAVGAPLVPTTPPEGGYSLMLPAGWELADQGRPNHARDVWRDPNDPHSSVTVTISNCSRCVTDRRSKPAPSRALPRGVASLLPISRWQVLYTLRGHGHGKHDAYPDRGTIIVTHVGDRITGFVRIDTVLPSELETSSTAILVSFLAV